MNHWHDDGSFSLHVFHKNNELAGYCSVLHAMQLIGTTGEYGRPLRAAVISFGATGRGAVTALNACGVNDVHVLTHRDVTAVASPIHSARMVHFERDADNPARCHALCRKRPGAAGGLPRQIRHRGQLRAAGHRRAADVRRRQRPGRVLARQPHRRRVMRRRAWASAGHDPHLRGPDVHRGRQRPLLRRGPQPVATCGTPPPGRSAKPCCRTCGPCSAAPAHGTSIRPSGGPSRSAGASSRTQTSCPSSTARRNTRTRRSVNTNQARSPSTCLSGTSSRLQPFGRARSTG